MESERRNLTRKNLVDMINKLDLEHIEEVIFEDNTEKIDLLNDKTAIERNYTITIKYKLEFIDRQAIFRRSKRGGKINYG